ncbi:MAG TPA: CHAD domain-containing protein [Candidatus Baltobacteraceae bacterium]
MSKTPRFDDLKVETPLAQASRTILRRLAEAVLHEAPDVLRGDDVRAVHNMRVALRRTRTLLQVLSPCYRRRPFERVRVDLRTLARRLGKVRDADVHLGALRSALGGATVEEADGISHAIDAHYHDRRRALARFAIALSQFDRDYFLSFVESARGEANLGEFLPPVIKRRLRRFIKALEYGLDDESDGRLHAARIAGKRLRYILEAFRELFGPEVKTALASLELIQERLGSIIDAAHFVARYDELLLALEPGDARIIGLRAQIGACELARERALAELHTLWDSEPPYPVLLAGLISSALASVSISA